MNIFHLRLHANVNRLPIQLWGWNTDSDASPCLTVEKVCVDLLVSDGRIFEHGVSSVHVNFALAREMHVIILVRFDGLHVGSTKP